MRGKYAVQQWCSDEAAEDIGTERIGELAAKSYAQRTGLTIDGDVEVRVFDVRTDTNFRMENDHPPGCPIMVLASFRGLSGETTT